MKSVGQIAIKEAEKVKNNPYWLDKSKELITQANVAIAAAEAAARSNYRPSSRSRSRNYSNTYSNPTPPVYIPAPPPKPPIPPSTNPIKPSPTKSNRRSIVCLNKHSPMPKCRK